MGVNTKFIIDIMPKKLTKVNSGKGVLMNLDSFYGPDGVFNVGKSIEMTTLKELLICS